MPPARGRDVFLSKSIDSSNESPSADLSDNDFYLSKNNLMDLDEFLFIHETRTSSNEEITPSHRRPTSDLLSKLLHTVHNNLGLPASKPDIDDADSESCSSDDGGEENNPSPVRDHAYVALKNRTRGKVLNVESSRDVRTEESQCRRAKRRKARTYKYNPKPVQQKTSRSFVPDMMKDEDYWERRKKNNLAAKKSREDRRRKELEVLQKMSKLQNNNDELTAKVEMLEAKNALLQHQLKKLSSQS